MKKYTSYIAMRILILVPIMIFIGYEVKTRSIRNITSAFKDVGAEEYIENDRSRYTFSIKRDSTADCQNFEIYNENILIVEELWDASSGNLGNEGGWKTITEYSATGINEGTALLYISTVSKNNESYIRLDVKKVTSNIYRIVPTELSIEQGEELKKTLTDMADANSEELLL